MFPLSLVSLFGAVFVAVSGGVFTDNWLAQHLRKATLLLSQQSIDLSFKKHSAFHDFQDVHLRIKLLRATLLKRHESSCFLRAEY
jgi:hypothetical protein